MKAPVTDEGSGGQHTEQAVVSLSFVIDSLPSDSDRQLVQPASGAPGGGGRLCPYDPQHRGGYNQAFSLL